MGAVRAEGDEPKSHEPKSCINLGGLDHRAEKNITMMMMMLKQRKKSFG
jgi:hypothetical protein